MPSDGVYGRDIMLCLLADGGSTSERGAPGNEGLRWVEVVTVFSMICWGTGSAESPDAAVESSAGNKESPSNVAISLVNDNTRARACLREVVMEGCRVMSASVAPRSRESRRIGISR